MKNWQKILIATIGTGLSGGLAYASSLLPGWGIPLGIASSLATAVMFKLIGWSPTK
jgi:hypothetical protein